MMQYILPVVLLLLMGGIGSMLVVQGKPSFIFVPGANCGITGKEIKIFDVITAADLPLLTCAMVTDYNSFRQVYIPYEGDDNTQITNTYFTNMGYE